MAIIDADLLGDVINFDDAIIQDTPTDVFADLITDEVEFGDVFATHLTANVMLTDTLQFSELLAGEKWANAELIDAYGLSEFWELTGAFGVTLIDSYRFSDYLNPAVPFAAGWALNITSGAASRYSFPLFNSFATQDGVIYGANEDGIFELEGPTDDGEPIHWFLMTRKTDFESRLQKVASRAYIAIKYDGSVWLKTLVGGTDQTRIYKLVSTNNEMFQRRLPIGRGVEGVYWQFALQDVDGEAFELDAILVYPVALTRRFR